MDIREVILERAAELLAQSPTGEVSTRAVCEAAQIGQPMLYRLFGDKAGLMVAVVDHVWDQYLAEKRSAAPSEDPLDDLRAGWDAHLTFALANPQAYRLMMGATSSTQPLAVAEAMSLLRKILVRLAAQGRLRISPDDAARVVMGTTTGVALALLVRPAAYPDDQISVLAREATLRSVLVDQPPATDAIEAAATTLRVHLENVGQFTAAECALLDQWLADIQTRARPSP